MDGHRHTLIRDTIPAAQFFALAQPGQRFRAWPTRHHDLHAGLILTATTGAERVGDDLCVSFTYPDWWHVRDGGMWRSTSHEHRFELIPPGAHTGDLCGCGQHGERVPDPYLIADGNTTDADARPLLLCTACLTDVTALVETSHG